MDTLHEIIPLIQQMLYVLGQHVQLMTTKQYLITLVFMLFILYVPLYTMHRMVKKRLTIMRTPTSKVRSAAQGYVELSGKAGQLLPDQPILAPLSGTPCAWYYCAIEVYDRARRHPGWVGVKRSASENLFLLHGQTGDVVIDPQGCIFDLTPRSTKHWVVGAKQPKPKIHGEDMFFQFKAKEKYRFTEVVVEPNEALLMLGFFSYG